MRPEKPRTTTFGKELSAMRQEQRLSVSKLAEMMGVTPPYISQLETKPHPPAERIIRRICAALDVVPVRLLRSAGLIPMPLAATLRATKTIVQLEDEMTEEERNQLVEYLDYLRFRAHVG